MTLRIEHKLGHGIPLLGGKVQVPTKFKAFGEATGLPGVQVVLDIEVDSNGQGHCYRLELEAGDQPLTGKSMRALRLGELVKEATAAAGTLWVNEGEVSPGVTRFAPAAPGQADSIYRELLPIRRARRNDPLTESDLKAIARAYRAAAAEGNRPTQTVAERVSPPVSRATASRWIRQARDAGFLGPAKSGKASG